MRKLLLFLFKYFFSDLIGMHLYLPTILSTLFPKGIKYRKFHDIFTDLKCFDYVFLTYIYVYVLVLFILEIYISIPFYYLFVLRLYCTVQYSV